MTAAATLSDEDLYFSVEKLIDHTVWRFIRRYGGDFEELRANANLSYAKWFRKYDPTRGTSFSSFISSCVWYELIDELRPRLSKLSRSGPVLGGDSLASASYRERDWLVNEFIEELSQDAQIVVKLCLETPKDIAKIAEDKGGLPSNLRSTIRQFLHRTGWTYRRVAESFDEIRKALG